MHYERPAYVPGDLDGAEGVSIEDAIHLLFAINFFMLGAYSGGLLNAVAVIRAILFLKKDKSLEI